MRGKQVTVLGAGIQGVCVALALSRSGHNVTVFDEAPDCMLRASLTNEGKIHLGHVYANDNSFQTPALMMQSAMQFASLIEGWVEEPCDWSTMRSNPFTYIVAPDSLLSPETLFEHYERLSQEYRKLGKYGAATYLGTQPESMWQEVPIPEELNADSALAAVATPEVSVDLVKLRTLLRRSLHEHCNIEMLYQHHVASVSRTSGGFKVEGTSANGDSWQRSTEIVINCLWEGRLAIDQQMDALPQRDWVHRLKYRVLADLPQHLAALPSLTFVLGRYGDIVTMPDTRTAYLSWYPACLKGWSRDLTVPEAWKTAGDDRAHTAEATEVANDVLQAFDSIVPGIGRSDVKSVAAGVIFSWGATDISDPASELHSRHEIGVAGTDGYFSINTGKYTSAPLFAKQLLSLI